MKKILLALIGLSVVLVAALVLEMRDKPAPAPEPVTAPALTQGVGKAAAPALVTVGALGAAAITGTVTFRGTPPPAPEKFSSAFPGCAKAMADAPADPGLILAKSGGVKNVFVWVRDGVPLGNYRAPADPVRLDQRACEYEPRVFGIRVGQPLELANSDSMLHNVHAFHGASTVFNAALANAGMSVTKKFDGAEVMSRITCDVHPWMRAYAGVMTHPFYSVSAADGSFAIKNLPGGTYTISAWHERLGRVVQNVLVADGASKAITLEFKSDELPQK